MIEKNVNVNKKSVTRLVKIDYESKRVNILDTRYYTKNDKIYPSVTSILQHMPKNKFFENWLKDVGHNADFIVKKAADEGTQVHDAIERYLMGEKIEWIDTNGYSKYSLEVWKMILKFHEFWSVHKPTLIESEIHLFSDIYNYAGTCDLVVELDGKRWLLDIKTSNSLHTSHNLQLAAYAQAWNELYEEKIDHIGIIWLKSSKRGEDKKGKGIQGKGWELYEPEKSIEENLKLFGYIHELYKLDHPETKATGEQLPTEIQIGS
jgi:ATP-dependent exoDNAse (exonuclease V) beta subunit